MPKKAPDESPDFEKSLAELESLVETMERGDLPLEKALEQFERGVALTRSCQSALKAASIKVEQLVERDGEATLEPLDTDED
jgi:exodeoxyribonuclease VII small subunit